jgi:hypothetical protein
MALHFAGLDWAAAMELLAREQSRCSGEPHAAIRAGLREYAACMGGGDDERECDGDDKVFAGDAALLVRYCELVMRFQRSVADYRAYVDKLVSTFATQETATAVRGVRTALCAAFNDEARALRCACSWAVRRFPCLNPEP